ncbi:SAM-dependent methyltransferase [Actinomycetes bacterium KLBMP 9797]
MGNATPDASRKPATAARIYDYFLGGVHNFPADQEAARAMLTSAPAMLPIARVNRAFLRRAVSCLTEAGVRQFLDIGSGIPTAGNVHEIAQRAVPDARVVYVDIDPVAVAESLELLEGNRWATAIRADLRTPRTIVDHPQVRKLIDFSQPVALLLVGVLYFVPDDAEAYAAVAELTGACAPGSYLVVSHSTIDEKAYDPDALRSTQDVYKRQTATPLTVRTRDGIRRFFDGFELLEPGLVWQPEWRPEPTDPEHFRDEPERSRMLAAVGRLP